MRVNTLLATAVALLGSASLTYAGQTIVSPALQTGSNTAGACYVRNIGKTPISVQVTALENFAPGFISVAFQDCNDLPLAGGHTCVLLVNDLPDDDTFECSAAVSGNVKNIRASAEVRAILTAGLQVIAAQDLR
jgi:hypothetical protein